MLFSFCREEIQKDSIDVFAFLFAKTDTDLLAGGAGSADTKSGRVDVELKRIFNQIFIYL